MSKIEVNAIEPQCGTTLTVGAVGTTVTVPSNVVKSNALQASDAGNIISQSGTTITLGATGDSINLASGATQSGFGRTGTVDWITTPKTATFTAVSGEGYFCNTSGGAFTVNLPAGVAGAIVSLADYAATWQTNAVTVSPNGTDKIGSLNENAVLITQGQSVTFVYVDSTQGWINTMDSTSNVRGAPPFMTATVSGACNTLATAPCCANTKIATFTGPGTFCVSAASGCAANNVVSYMVVAGGGGSHSDNSGGGGGGGFREYKSPVTPYTASPLDGNPGGTAITVSAQGYAIQVGGGGAATPTPGANNGDGTPSIFSTIVATGGGAGECQETDGRPGGSGGGAGSRNRTGGSGNLPPVSPPQGQNGGDGAPPAGGGGGGGGASAAGSTAPTGGGGNGGNGIATSITSSSVTRSGGGGGGGGQPGGQPGGSAGTGGAGAGGPGTSLGGNGTNNTGGGAGGGGQGAPGGSTGGSGIVIIRYKFQ